MAKEIKRWKCEHCKKHFASKKYTESHEKRCFFNLENKTCPTCTHFNNLFNPALSKCYKLNRGQKRIEIDYGAEVGKIFEKEFNLFTEFCIYNCPDWTQEVESEE
jgi:hypothetical protein